LHFDARSARDERKNQLNKATEIETAAWPVLRAVSIAISGGVSIGGRDESANYVPVGLGLGEVCGCLCDFRSALTFELGNESCGFDLRNCSLGNRRMGKFK
jgi:hypothetical protein